MTAHPIRPAVLVAGLVSCALLVPACSESEPQPTAAPAETAADAPAPAQVYEGVLGVVAEVPVAGDPSTSFQIRHEHIPGFISPRTGELNVNPDGSTGMKPMTMPFPAGEGLDLAGIEPGDKVRFTLAVWTEPSLSFAVTAIEELDPDTEISFELKPAP